MASNVASAGKIVSATGQVFIQRDGKSIPAGAGTEMRNGDFVTTGPGGKAGVALADQTRFSLGEKASMKIDNVDFKPADHANSSLVVSVVKGAFMFITGQIAHLSKDKTLMKVQTTTATIGIRGTQVAGDIYTDGRESAFTLLPNPDGARSFAEITNGGGSTVLDQPNMSVRVSSFFSAPSEPYQAPPSQIQQQFGSVLATMNEVSQQMGLPPPVNQQTFQPPPFIKPTAPADKPVDQPKPTDKPADAQLDKPQQETTADNGNAPPPDAASLAVANEVALEKQAGELAYLQQPGSLASLLLNRDNLVFEDTVVTRIIEGTDETIDFVAPSFLEVALNTAPTAEDDAVATTAGELAAVEGNVLTNDDDADGNNLTVALVTGSTAGSAGDWVTGSYGDLRVAADGSYRYVLNSGKAQYGVAAASGAAVTDTFTYTVGDGLGGVATATLEFTVADDGTAGMDRFVSAHAIATTARAADLSGDILTDATYLNGATMPAGVTVQYFDNLADETAFTANPTTGTAAGKSVLGAYGTLLLNPSGTFEYVVDRAATTGIALGDSATDTFVYKLSNGQIASFAVSIDNEGIANANADLVKFTYYYADRDVSTPAHYDSATNAWVDYTGDYYTGYVYTKAGLFDTVFANHSAVETLLTEALDDGNVADTSQSGYYVIDNVTHGQYGVVGSIKITSYYDEDSGQHSSTPFAKGLAGVGSEKGAVAYGGYYDYVNYFFEPDIDPNNPPATIQFYSFTYQYSGGDFYTGYGYATAGTYVAGQSVDSGDIPGLGGEYIIETVQSIVDDPNDDVQKGQVYVTSYYDANTTTLGETTVNASGLRGLGSERGNVFDLGGSGDSFDAYNAADISGAAGSALKLYYFHYDFGGSGADTYYGYGYTTESLAASATAYASKTNELGTGAYYIDAVYASEYGIAGEVYVTAYNDVDSAGWNTTVTGYGKQGLGSESGTVSNYLNNALADSFSNYYEGDVGTSGGVHALQLYYFSYTYDGTSADTYYGYGYAADNTYAAGGTTTQDNENGSGTGTYTILYETATDFGVEGEVYVTSYYDLDYAGWNTNVSGFGQFGLGSESGTVSNYSGSVADPFSSYKESDVDSSAANALQLYYFRYDYKADGSGDYYHGYGYYDPSKHGNVSYTDGQTFTGIANEIAGSGKYTIESTYDSTWGIDGEVYVYDYYDQDGAGWNTSASGFGQFGLGSEEGSVYNYAGFSDKFSSYNEGEVPFTDTATLQLYYFRYDYGNGDFYYGYGYNDAAKSGVTYRSGGDDPATAGITEVGARSGLANDAGGGGAYTIESVFSTTWGTHGEVYVNSYYDGDNAGWNTSVSGFGQFGLGSESGSVYNYSGGADQFSNYGEADVPNGAGGLQLYYFRYEYGNGDYYYGYGYNDTTQTGVTYRAGGDDATTGGVTEVGTVAVGSGTYTIESAYLTSVGTSGEVYVNSYYDSEAGGAGWNTSVSGFGQFGLASESGTVYNYNGLADAFSVSNEADVPTSANTSLQLYYFRFDYDTNTGTPAMDTGGDYYYGYGYNDAALTGITYKSSYSQGSLAPGEVNKVVIAGVGTYTIESAYATSYGTSGEVNVDNYYDQNGAGWNTSVSGRGLSGLGSEEGLVYNINNGLSDSFSKNNQADVGGAAGTLQVYYFRYDYNDASGDYYYGYGYNDTSQHAAYAYGSTVAGSGAGAYTIEGVYDVANGSGTDNAVYAYSYYDGDGAGWSTTASASGSSGLGSETGTVWNYQGGSDSFAKNNEADVPLSATLQLYYFRYEYAGSGGDIYYGYGYNDTSLTGTTYAAGQISTGTLASVNNDTGSTGHYFIEAVSQASSGTSGQVYVTSYKDADTATGFNTWVNGSGSFGLGSESGTVYDYNGLSDSFSNANESDLSGSSSVQIYYFHYDYGNGDTYYGWGYNDATLSGVTYAAAWDTGAAGTDTKTVTLVDNDIGADAGTYTIDSVFTTTSGTSGLVYVTSYYDYDGAGWNTTVSGGGSFGLGSEEGSVNNYNGFADSFSKINEADVPLTSNSTLQLYYFRFDYGGGDYYYGHGTNDSALTGVTYRYAWDASTLKPGEVSSFSVAGGTYTIMGEYGTSYGTSGEVVVDSYYDAEAGNAGWNTSVYGSGTRGLGSESGTVYNFSNVADSFSNSNDADLSATGVGGSLQQYYFRYDYTDGSGDFYYGYGYKDTSVDSYAAGTTVTVGGKNYYIESAFAAASGTAGEVYVNSYYDGDGAQWNTSAWGSGTGGLGSESGTVWNYQGTSDSFANNNEADVANSATLQQVFFRFNYSDASGDYYYGYAYNDSALTGTTYVAAGTVAGTGGTYTIESVSQAYYGSSGHVEVYSYYDADGGGYWNTSVSGSGERGLGSESGAVYNGNGVTADAFSSTNEADVPGSLTDTMQAYYFRYEYGSGEYYYGYGYNDSAISGITYAVGTLGTTYGNEAGSGQYVIESVYSTSLTGVHNQVYVNGYYDADGALWNTSVNGTGYSGLGSESGTVTSNGQTDSFSNYFEADPTGTATNQQYWFSYHYGTGSGDYYYGSGYEAAGTYALPSFMTVGGNQFWASETRYLIDNDGNGTVDQTLKGKTYYDWATTSDSVHLIDSDANTGNGYEWGSFTAMTADHAAWSVVGYYAIDSVVGTVGGTPGEVTVNSYYDQDGAGWNTTVTASGSYGLGSESGSVYDYYTGGADTFSNANEATISASGGLQLYYYRYEYGNGDYYYGYGYAATNTFNSLGVIGSGALANVDNDTSSTGHYYIENYYTTDTGTVGQVYVSGYYDADNSATGTAYDGAGWNTWVDGSGTNGLGSEAGTVYSGSGADAFSKTNEANPTAASTIEQYNFRYEYGNGDVYYGYGYAAANVYEVGEIVTGTLVDVDNEYAANSGTYTIESVYSASSGTAGQVYVTSYYDGDGALWNTWVNGSGSFGLGSESGTVTSDGQSDSFSNYLEADPAGTAANQQYWFSYRYGTGSGDYYYGSGYEAAGTYALPNFMTVGGNQFWASETRYLIDNDGNGTVDQTLKGKTYYDWATTNASVYLIDSDANTGNGYEWNSFAAMTAAHSGWSVLGYYTVDSVVGTVGGTPGEVTVNSYYDQDGAGWNTSVTASGRFGLGSESGTVYDYSTGGADNFSNLSEATISATGGLQLYYYRYEYGNGDYYYGYGYAAANTYTTTGQIASGSLASIYNDSGVAQPSGHYYIDSFYATDTGTLGQVYVNGYYDSDNSAVAGSNDGAGWNTWVSGSGSGGLGSESGTVYSGSGADAFSKTNEANPTAASTIEQYNFRYQYGNGDVYYGYGYAAAGTYTTGEITAGLLNDVDNEIAANSGTYYIESVYSAPSGTLGQVYVTSYYDADGAYWNTWTSATGSSGLGSESGTVYGYNPTTSSYDLADSFSNYYEADLLASNAASLQRYSFTYHYAGASGDYYMGYAYATAGEYSQPGMGASGYWETPSAYLIDNTSDGIPDVIRFGKTYFVWDSNTQTGTNYHLIDTDGNPGNGLEASVTNLSSLSGLLGYYTIDSMYSTAEGTAGQVFVNSYYDGDGAGWNTTVSGSGSSGIGSEAGTVFANGAGDAFSNINEADPGSAGAFNQQYWFSYRYLNGSGDIYYGSGYVLAGSFGAAANNGLGYWESDSRYVVDTNSDGTGDTMLIGRVYYNYSDGNYYHKVDTDDDGSLADENFGTAITPVTGTALGYYMVDSVFSTGDGTAGQVYINSYYDADGALWNTTVTAGGSGGLGSESGTVRDNVSLKADSFDADSEADPQTALATNQQYWFSYRYLNGSGDNYYGSGYALAGTFGTAANNGSGFWETDARYVVDINGDGTADMTLKGRTYNDWQNNVVHHLIDTDSNGSYETDVTTLSSATAATVLDGSGAGANVNLIGYYVIDSVFGTGDGTAGQVYVNSYYDGDGAFGNTTVTASGSGGLGSESGTVRDNVSMLTTYFDQDNEADPQSVVATNQQYWFTYRYLNGSGDSYSGSGYVLAGVFAAGATNGSGYWEVDTRYLVDTDVDGDLDVILKGRTYTDWNSSTVHHLIDVDNNGSYETDLTTLTDATAATILDGTAVGANVNVLGYYAIDSVFGTADGTVGQLMVNSYYDADGGAGWNTYAQGYGNGGLGSESGLAFSWTTGFGAGFTQIVDSDPLSGSAYEDQSRPIIGAVGSFSSWNEGAGISLASGGTAYLGEYGVLVTNGSSYEYVVESALLQSLAQGASITETFAYFDVGLTPSNLSFTINGLFDPDNYGTPLVATAGTVVNGTPIGDWIDLSAGSTSSNAHGMDGNDVFDLGGSGDFGWISGGGGIDTVKVGQQSGFSLTGMSGIEKVDLSGGSGTTLQLSLADVFSVSDTQMLVVTGEGTDQVSSVGTGWTLTGTQTMAATTYDVYHNGDAYNDALLIIQQGVTFNQAA